MSRGDTEEGQARVPWNEIDLSELAAPEDITNKIYQKFGIAAKAWQACARVLRGQEDCTWSHNIHIKKDCSWSHNIHIKKDCTGSNGNHVTNICIHRWTYIYNRLKRRYGPSVTQA
jgi:hypothetical protein